MRTLTDLALNKMVQKYIDSLSHVLYTLNVDNRIYIIQKFIDGNLTIQAILSNNDDNIVNSIRKAGYAVSVIDVKGLDSEQPKYMLFMEINKKRLTHLKKLIKDLDERAFIVVNETKMVHNGYFK